MPAAPAAARWATPADEDAFVRGALGNAWETEALRLDEATVRRAVRRLLADPARGLGVVAEDRAVGEAVGTLYLTAEWSDWHDAWYWWVQSLYVAPAHRGRGAYSAMYRFLRAEAARRGDVREVRLYVERGNEAGLRAYRGHGMRELPYLVFGHPVAAASEQHGEEPGAA